MPTSKPSLVLTTPVTASFPADALRSAASARTPHSPSWRNSLASAGLPSAGLPSAGLASAGLVSPAIANIKQEEGCIKTPITPPMAYMDFLKSMTLTSPTVGMVSPPPTGKLNRTSTATSTTSVKSNVSSGSEDSAADGEKEMESAPSTATSEATDCSCDCDHVHKSPKAAAATKSTVPPSPFANIPMSAPPAGTTTFPSMKIPPSPYSDSPVHSPFSARSVRSPFDWDAALKARRYAEVKGSSHSCSKASSKASSKTSVRHIREVVTRTVTYTPRMDPAPKGKRRKVE